MNEEYLINLLAIDEALARLPEEDRVALELHFRFRQPDDYNLRWPPRFVDIADYIGAKYRGYNISESTIRYRIRAIQAQWRGERGPLRPRTTARDLHQQANHHTNPAETAGNPPEIARNRERTGDERAIRSIPAKVPGRHRANRPQAVRPK